MKRVFLPVALALLGVSGWSRPALIARSNGTSAVRFVDVTDASGIRFKHISDPQKRYIVESMSGGVALFDYDNDGWLDIFFTNSLTVDTANNPNSSSCALYHNNGDGTFTDVTEKSGLAHPGWAMGVVAADYDGDGWTDLYVTCLGHNHLYHNNHDGTFTDTTAKAGVDDSRWSTGARAATRRPVRAQPRRSRTATTRRWQSPRPPANHNRLRLRHRERGDRLRLRVRGGQRRLRPTRSTQLAVEEHGHFS